MVHTLLGNHEEMNITGIALGLPRLRHGRAVPVLPAGGIPPGPGSRVRPDAAPGGAHASSRSPDRRPSPRTLCSPTGRGRSPGGTPRPGAPTSRASTTPAATGSCGRTPSSRSTTSSTPTPAISETFSSWPLREINTVMRSELEFFQGRMRNPQKYSEPFKPKIVYEPDSPLWFRGLATKGGSGPGRDRPDPGQPRRPGHGRRAQLFLQPSQRAARALSISRRDVARFQDKVWIMDTGISGQLRRRALGADLSPEASSRLWGETEEVAARTSGHRAPLPEAPGPRGDARLSSRPRAVKSREPGPGGRTDAWRLTLESRGKVHPGRVQVRRPAAARSAARQLPATTWPPTRWTSTSASASSRRSSSARSPRRRAPSRSSSATPLSEPERKEKRIPPEDPAYYERAMADLLVFQNLVYDDCRNEKDTLIGGDGRPGLPGRLLRGLRPQEGRRPPLHRPEVLADPLPEAPGLGRRGSSPITWAAT
ncbi:MAG: hypothetical protein M0C28_03225 [Candidatus Moduliflexus flocculans]|nr:hypothetical protein [Candidatus Moduliflexus flocculans]